ncbi:MAG: hypothetical protein NUW02_00260 [Candidatus Campbellbacteria bacterium]|nr:hypothetical protein [Candidatus Campbellbacteria bacterium]
MDEVHKTPEEKSKLSVSEMEIKLLEGENNRLKGELRRVEGDRWNATTAISSLEEWKKKYKPRLWKLSVTCLALFALLIWKGCTASDYADQLAKIAKEKAAAVEGLKVGEHQLVPVRHDVKVTNPDPIIYGGRTYTFGDSCYIEVGGTATIVAIQSQTRTFGLEERIWNTFYLKYEGDATDEKSCPSGVIFTEEFWRADNFREWSQDYAKRVRARDEEIARAREVLSVGVLQVDSDK